MSWCQDCALWHDPSAECRELTATLTDDDLEAVAAGKGGPQLFGRMASTRPFRPLLGWEFWRAHAVAK